VVDETGGVVGAVTIADVAEELIGDVLDENEAPDQSIQQEPGGALIVRGETPIHELERVLDLDLALDGVRASTVAGLIIEQLGRIPQAKERVGMTKNLEAEILDATERRVRVMRLRKLDSGEKSGENQT
jgi:putative hemolysin